MKVFHSKFFAATIALVAGASGANAASFAPINGGYDQSATGIFVGPRCRSSGLLGNSVPKTMFTVEPADSVTVSTTPANLVKVSNEGGTLKLEWNDEVAGSPGEGGVRIGFPAGQLVSIGVGRAATVQVLDGFTAVNELDVDGASTVRATFTGLRANGLAMHVGGASAVNVKSNVAVDAGVGGASTANIEAPSVKADRINGASTVGVSGDVSGGSVNGASTLSVSGSVTGSVAANGASTVNVGGGCNGVLTGGASSCNSRGGVSVTVDTSEQDQVMQRGKSKCWSSSGVAANRSTRAAIAAAAGLVFSLAI